MWLTVHREGLGRVKIRDKMCGWLGKRSYEARAAAAAARARYPVKRGLAWSETQANAASITQRPSKHSEIQRAVTRSSLRSSTTNPSLLAWAQKWIDFPLNAARQSTDDEVQFSIFHIFFFFQPRDRSSSRFPFRTVDNKAASKRFSRLKYVLISSGMELPKGMSIIGYRHRIDS
jgi:hypothetical protein